MFHFANLYNIGAKRVPLSTSTNKYKEKIADILCICSEMFNKWRIEKIIIKIFI